MPIRRLRPRFTVRRAMIAVAALAVMLGLWSGVERRRRRSNYLYYYHRSRAGPTRIRSFDPGRRIYTTEEGRWHHEQALRYDWAASHPWAPLPDQVPEPE